jgi:hypothetical protein
MADNTDLKIYDNSPGFQVTKYLNESVPSGHMYGDDDPDRGMIYGDGRTQWNHLQLKIEGGSHAMVLYSYEDMTTKD